MEEKNLYGGHTGKCGCAPVVEPAPGFEPGAAHICAKWVHAH